MITANQLNGGNGSFTNEIQLFYTAICQIYAAILQGVNLFEWIKEILIIDFFQKFE